MTNRFLVYTGTISYGLYLLHKIPVGMVEVLHVERHPYLPMPIIFVMTYILAALSWRLLEKPFLRLKRHFQLKPPRMDRQVGPSGLAVNGEELAQEDSSSQSN